MSYRPCLWRRFCRDNRGNVAMIFGIVLVPLIGLIGLAIDYGIWTHQRAALFKAADSASIAGLRRLLDAIAQGDTGGAATRAEATAAAFITASGIGATVNLVSASTGDPPKVTVELSQQAGVFFSRIVFPELVDIGVVSEAVATRVPDACVIALEPTARVGIDFNLSGSVVAHNCSIWSNAQTDRSIDGNGSGSVKSAATCAVGTALAKGKISFEPAVRSGCLPVHDPLASWEPPAVAGCSASNTRLEKPGIYILDPGVYCGGLAIHGGAVVRLKPGLYVMKDGPLTVLGNSSLSGSDVSILLTGRRAAVNFGGAAVVDLSAPSSGPMAGIVIAAGRDQPIETSVLRGGSLFRLEGHLYLPTHDLRYSGGPSGALPADYTTVVGRTITFDGNVQIDFRKSTSAPSYAAKAFIGIHIVR